MAFPRLNAMSFWLLIFGGILLHFSALAGAAPSAGRFSYAPLSETPFSSSTVVGKFLLTDGSALFLAIKEWLTPDGESYWHKGIKPEIEVALPPEARLMRLSAEASLTPTELNSCGDVQLLRALDVLTDPSSGSTPVRSGPSHG
jgi:carboxyl-terminal processing protease